MPAVIGIDFDNTLVDYDDVLKEEAFSQGWIQPGEERSKKEIREVIRRLPDGEILWRRLQSVVYGQRMDLARLAQGAGTFLHRCKKEGAAVFVVSHKTSYPAEGEKVNLREVAWAWMEKQNLFSPDGFGLQPERVSFHSSREQKIDRICETGCTHFIDDLEETFQEPSFPATVEKILYAPHRQKTDMKGVRVTHHWDEISEYLFDGDQ